MSDDLSPHQAVHSVGARVIELALSVLRGSFSSPLRIELYGQEFALFGDDIMAKAEPNA